jgi:hypothetical protein
MKFVPLTLAALLIVGAAQAAENISPAEQALFVTNHLATLQPPATLSYSFRKSGSLEQGFEDKVAIALRAQADGKCCTASAAWTCPRSSRHRAIR